MNGYLTVEEYSELVNASYFTIIGYIRSGKLKAEKIAGRYFIKEDEKIKFKVPGELNSDYVELEK